MLEILGSIHAERLICRFHGLDSNTVFEGAKLLERLHTFKRRGIERGEHQEGTSPVGIEANVADDVIKRLVAAGAVPATALGAPAVAPSPIKEPLPPEWKQCGNTAHPPYDSNEHDECPIHANERKERYRAKQKAKKPAGKKPAAQETT